MKTFTFEEVVKISKIVRANVAPDKRTEDLIIDHLVELGVMFRVYIDLCNNSEVRPTPQGTVEFWTKEDAEHFVKCHNEKHGWVDNNDYMNATFYS